ncbi:DinB family protein [Polaribacter sp.]|uniref:DinB family protein n=1 Tax=Polaribacter sp. TaxID=1920175 RepID=UPI003F6CA1EA
MINAIVKNLEKGIQLLQTITDEQYSNTSIPPYCSSIGCHTRHILDVFSCVLNGFEHKNIDLTKRERNEIIELKTTKGIEYFEAIIHQIKNISIQDLNMEVKVIDNLGLGNEQAFYTLGAILMQAQSHAIHHYASIGYLIYQLGIELPDTDFGYNPTTPNKNLRAS